MDSESRLLNLPAELRLNIWEYLLSPKINEAQWATDDPRIAITPISRMCSISEHSCVNPVLGSSAPSLPLARAHHWDADACRCLLRPFYLVDTKEHLCPAILRVNKKIYTEALPSLYQRRKFVADPNRVFVCLHERVMESWFLFHRFLSMLSPEARSNIHQASVPMLLSKYEVYGCRDAFYAISHRLPALKRIEFEVAPSSYREHWREETESPPLLEYWLGPIMAFGEADITITAVDKHDIGPSLFERVKVAIEVRVFNQLLKSRIKRSQRRMARIKSIIDERNGANDSNLLEILHMDGL